MSAVVGAWVNGLEKVRDKVRIKNPLVLSRKSKQGQAVDEEEADQGRKEIAHKDKSSKGVEADDTMSESTVFFLMDRFAAW